MNTDVPRCCIIIPVYRHVGPLKDVLRLLEKYELPCFLVDDGNAEPVADALAAELRDRHWVRVVRLKIHSGKGAACVEGARIAEGRGFSHGIFMDADHQHEAADIPTILTLVRRHPTAMILGSPLFDRSAPLKRRFGRIVSNVWVWIETLSLDIRDSLCGFRCLPLRPLLTLAASAQLSKGMDFDPDIVVRLFWQGMPVVNFPTRIRYPTGGVSNFCLIQDNVALFRLHTRLFFGMLARSSSLVSRHWKSPP